MNLERFIDFSSLEKGSFDILEPKEDCKKDNDLDVVLVPTVGITPNGIRLGYGHGYYDRFLANYQTVSISLTFEKQIIKKIPKQEHDITIDWIVTEDRVFKSNVR